MAGWVKTKNHEAEMVALLAGLGVPARAPVGRRSLGPPALN